MEKHNDMIGKKRPIEFLVHIAAWTLILCQPFFFTGRDTQINLADYIRFVVGPASFMVVFYLNYFLIIDRFLYTKRQEMFFVINILLIAAVMAGVHLLMQVLPLDANMFPPRKIERWDMVRFFSGNAVIYVLVVGLSVGLKMTGSWYKADSERKELERSRSEAELQNLKSQLNPHFLFNTLNNIYSLIAFSPERAQETVHDLSRLLRYVLYDSSQPKVPLSKEIDFVKNYVELMKIRLPEHVAVQTDIDIADLSAEIAPLLFISPIENAFKHGVSNSKPSFINLSIKQAGGDVCCFIENSYFPKGGNDKSGSGIGLSNLRKRLSLLYPNAHDFVCKQEGNKYISSMTITIGMK